VPVPRAGRLAALAASCVATVALLAACGGGSKPAASTADPTNTGAAGFQAYLACLSQHGVTLPSQAARARPTFSFTPGTRPTRSPGSGFGGGGRGFGGGGGFGGGFNFDPNSPPTGVDQATWSAALTACKSLQPTFGGGTRGGSNFNNSAFTAYRNCLSDHGMKFPSTGAGGGGLNFNTADPTVAAALKACAPLRPTGGPNVSPSPTG
jgi:hypothetical protein